MGDRSLNTISTDGRQCGGLVNSVVKSEEPYVRSCEGTDRQTDRQTESDIFSDVDCRYNYRYTSECSCFFENSKPRNRPFIKYKGGIRHLFNKAVNPFRCSPTSFLLFKPE